LCVQFTCRRIALNYNAKSLFNERVTTDFEIPV
jgi:hypothetical protein